MNSDIIGTGAGGIQIRYCYFVADTVTDLPAANYYEGGLPAFTIGQGSDGYCIDDGSVRILDGSGTWQLKTAGTAAYTKAEVDALLATKEDVLTFDATPTENSTNPVTSNGIFQAFANFEVPSTIPGTMSIYDLSPGWWSRTSNLSQVTDTPSDYTGGFICHVINTGIGSPRRKMIDFFPISASNVGAFYRAVQTSGGWSAWYRYDGTQV